MSEVEEYNMLDDFYMNNVAPSSCKEPSKGALSCLLCSQVKKESCRDVRGEWRQNSEEAEFEISHKYQNSRKECASFMVSLPVPFRYEYLMAETIFSQLLLLPRAPFKPLYYTLVIIDLCKALPGAFPSVVIGAVHALFDRIADMDMECRTRLILWFSHHLSNFQHVWPWGEWAYVKDLPIWAPQRVFVQEVLEREIRLSYWDKIKQILRNTINKTYNRITDLRSEILSLEKSVSSAEEATIKAQKELEAAEAKLELVDGQPVPAENLGRLKRLRGYASKAKDEETSLRESLEAKEALFARALEENKALFLSLYKNLGDVLKERLPPVSAEGKLPNLKAAHVESVAMDTEEPPAMDVDQDNGKTSSQKNGERITNGYNIGEREQWCLTTLGYVKTFSRQYATEIWPHIEMLEAEVFVEDAHPLFKKAAYVGLCRRS
ncbi:uncharacterized protein A4U43_C07F9300 [Asparagus officinalis]|uniref:MIF4G-like type 1 domain-containing protein n=1 Tax=Asparagus officinalis TaxID=4686 RepID=A0A5P1EDW2_ASPOF|nr:uncharacterized protein A4U43_C07F9300 [Asparagus officinalis]